MFLSNSVDMMKNLLQSCAEFRTNLVKFPPKDLKVTTSKEIPPIDYRIKSIQPMFLFKAGPSELEGQGAKENFVVYVLTG